MCNSGPDSLRNSIIHSKKKNSPAFSFCDQAVVAAIPATHDLAAKLSFRPGTRQVSERAPRLVKYFIAIDMEVHAVNLALKINMLAVCAVFVFVGAVLLGAF